MPVTAKINHGRRRRIEYFGKQIPIKKVPSHDAEFYGYQEDDCEPRYQKGCLVHFAVPLSSLRVTYVDAHPEQRPYRSG